MNHCLTALILEPTVSRREQARATFGTHFIVVAAVWYRSVLDAPDDQH